MIDSMPPPPSVRRTDTRLVEPHRRLMAAVLQTVVDDCTDPVDPAETGHRARADRRMAQAATSYLASTNRTWPFSFENLCETLGLDAGALRQALRRRRSA
jgi:hypothetical protein